MSKKPEQTDEDLLKELSGYNERAPRRHQIEYELNKRIAERAGASGLFWAKVAAWAGIVSVILAAIQLLK
jgi:hypothetical protein